MTWEIEFYEKDNGHCQVREFLEHPDQKEALPYILNRIAQLAEHGHRLVRPHADYLQDGIYELRVPYKRKQYRLLYFFAGKDRIVITTGLQKREGPVNPKDIRLAKEIRIADQEKRGPRKGE